ncbi:MAG: type IA DNA topoisomerase [Lachnospiraceae bacterium]|nr:type IA DNA topoisomerase [Lachnospiraceae bacterium]
MGKSLYIAEKPSVAAEFAKALKESFRRGDGYNESDSSIVTWCVGHLVTMSYPESYDQAMKAWRYDTLPFIPKEFKYEVIKDVAKQFAIVKELLNRPDVDRIYVCTDSGREGEYIYRLVDRMAKVPDTKDKRRVWIDSQTEEEVLRGIREAKPLSEYDHLSDAAYLRAKEDYLMGINFSRILTLKFGDEVRNFLGHEKRAAISVGRVMTCVLGMVVRRERDIRTFVKTPFYRVIAGFETDGVVLDGEFRAVEGSKYFANPCMYKENGFKEREKAEELIRELEGLPAVIDEIAKKNENKNPLLLFNLAELQNECSKLFKISPDETLAVTQELYEKKLVTYPRTDARVLSTAVAKVIDSNIKGLKGFEPVSVFADEVLSKETYKNIAKTKYVNDKQITDHYAIIPTGQGLQALGGLKPIARKVYELICRRFLSIFYPAAVYRKISLTVQTGAEKFFAGFKVLKEEGWLKVANVGKKQKEDASGAGGPERDAAEAEKDEDADNQVISADKLEMLEKLKKGSNLNVSGFSVREGETSPPKRYNSGSLILAMENAGQLIEDEDLRAQIKGSGIGTSATRAEILSKLVRISYLNLNKKTQIITPTLLGELIYEVVDVSVRSLLNPELTASWEKGLTYVAEGNLSEDEYMVKLDKYVSDKTNAVKQIRNTGAIRQRFDMAKKYY